MPYFSNFHRLLQDLQKTCPTVPNEIRASSCKQESRRIIRLGLGILMVDWERGILQSCSQLQDRRILLRRSKSSPCLVNHESDPYAGSLQIYFLPSALKVHHSSIVELFHLLYNKFSIILQFLE